MSEKNSSNKTLIVLVVITLIIVLGSGGFFSYYLFFKPKSANAQKNVPEKTVTLDSMVTNLADEGKSKYVKMLLTLGYTEKKLEKEITKKMPQIKHEILITLMNKTSEDLEVKKIQNVVSELKDKINSVLSDGKITNVYINDFIIQ